MALPRFFRTARPREFHYEPKYYDARKERMEERLREAEKKTVDMSEVQYMRTIGRGFISARHLKVKKTHKQSTLRLILLFLFLSFISYLLLFL